MALELEFLDGDVVEAYFRTNRNKVKKYLESKVQHVDDIGYFPGKVGPASVLYLVVILAEEYPGDPEDQSVNESVSNNISTALETCYPFPGIHPNHTLSTMIQGFVVVKRDATGYTKVWWPTWIHAPNGQYGCYNCTDRH